MAKISTKNLAQAIYGSKASVKEVVDFLYKRRLLGKSEEILKELENIENQEKDIVKMKVSSAKDIPDHHKKELEKEMKEKYGAREIVSECFTDRNLLGGMKIEIGEEVLDDTYRNRLNQLSKHLLVTRN